MSDDLGTVRWFGEPWPSPELPASVCADPRTHIDTPIGEFCGHCSEQIIVGDQGITIPYWSGYGVSTRLPYHLRCFLSQVVPEEVVRKVIKP